MRKISYMMFAFAMSFMMFSCQMEDNPIGVDDSGETGAGTITSMMLPDEVIDNLNTGDLSVPFDSEYTDYTFESMMMGGRGDKKPPMDKRKKDRKPIKDRGNGGIDLGLTDEQKAAIEQAREDYKLCSEEYRAIIGEIHRSVFEAANAQRQNIMTRLRAGEITKEEARELMTALRESTKAELEANADFQAAVEAMKICQENLKAAMDSILTDEQKALLLERAENRKNLRDKHCKKDSDSDEEDTDEDPVR